MWNRLGVHRQVEGPYLKRLFFSTIMFLDRRTAGPNEFLIITHANGSVEHLRGPIYMFENPVFHKSIATCSAYSLKSASEYIVVNRETRTPIKSEVLQFETSVQRVLIRGPNVFVPMVGDNIVSFSWHGQKAGDGFAMAPNADHFTTLYVGSRSWKVDLPFALSDQMKGTLQLSFTFHIYDINKMLDNTNDVTGNLLDNLKVDIANICMVHNQVNSLHDIHRLNIFNNMEVYVNLLACANIIGVQISQCSLRNISVSPEILRNLTEIASIESKMTRDRMAAKQAAELIEADIQARLQRVEQERALDNAIMSSKRQQLDVQFEFNDKEQQYNSMIAKSKISSCMDELTMKNNESLRVLSQLGEMGVNLTTLLTHDANKSSGGKGGGDDMVLTVKLPIVSEMFSTDTAIAHK